MAGDDSALMARLLASGQRIDVSDGHCVTAWRRWGDGPPTVLLHGGSGSWTHWVRNIEALAVSRTVLVPDLPGYGDSADPPPGSTVQQLAETVAQALDTVLPAGEPVDLVAFSFGSIVAGHIAAARPWRVGRLVLVGAVGLGLSRVGQRPLRPWRGQADPAVRDQIHRENLAALMFQDKGRIDAQAVNLHGHNVQRTRYVSKHSSRGAELRELLPAVEAPLFGIWGSGDATAPGQVQALGPLLQSLSPSAQFLVIQGAGHWVQYELADEFNQALRLLLAQ